MTVIARELDIGYTTANKIWRQWKSTGDVAPQYEKCREAASRRRKPAAVYERALDLKRAEPSWGAPLIRLTLAEAFAEQDLPSVRTLQVWFRRAGVQRSPRVRVKKACASRSKLP
jgi:hypothetical protein